MTRWCLECAQAGKSQAATREVDGDPLCDFHAKAAPASGEEPPAAPERKKPGPKPGNKKATAAPMSATFDLDPLGHRLEVAAATTAGHRVLWKARLSIQHRKDEFLFRAGEEFAEASTIAMDLLLNSPSCKITGAVIVGIERVARLWN